MKNNLPMTYIELSRENLIHNFLEFRKLLKKGTEIAFAIKGNAYGHGQNEIAKIAESYVDYFFVNSLLELKLLRKVSKKKTFLFGYVEKKDLKDALKFDAILAIFNKEQLLELIDITNKQKKKIEIHIPVDSFLGREGFLENEIVEILEIIKQAKYLKLGGIYSHFANIEDIRPDESFGRAHNFTHAQKQIKEYQKFLKVLAKYNFKNVKTHISATSGVLVYEKNKGINNIVRIGIGGYGLWPSPHIEFLYQNKFELKPVLAFKTKIAQIKTLPAGRTIGYGLTYMTTKETKIGILPVGYADGLDRRYSNKGEVLINGTRCKILGRVSMNMTVIDLSNLENVSIEDEVVIIGKQGKEEITSEEIGEVIGTINYEVTTRLSSILPRVIK
ncbi:MAG: alanine racemase [Candidatus Pacebacteria bacterium]|nr:alanine racemase [Candidatus Paceibacterota bacterium]